MQPNAPSKHETVIHRTIIARPVRGGGWRITDSAGLVGGFFRDRAAALKAVVRDRWAKDAIVEVVAESFD